MAVTPIMNQYAVTYRGVEGHQRSLRVAARTEEGAKRTLSRALPCAEVLRATLIECPERSADLEERA